MSSQTENAGSGGQGFISGSGSSWANPGDIGLTGSSFATFSLNSGSTESIEGYNFGFSVPSGATINGFSYSVFAERTSGSGTNCAFVSGSVKLVLGSSTGTPAGGTNFAGNAWSAAGLTETAGTSTDLWNLTTPWTSSNCNSNTEGTGPTCSFQASRTTGTVTGEANSLESTVFYTPAPSGPLFMVNQNLNGLGTGGPFFANPIG